MLPAVDQLPKGGTVHVHIGALNFVISFAYLIIGLFLLRLLAARFPDNVLGQAAAALN